MITLGAREFIWTMLDVWLKELVLWIWSKYKRAREDSKPEYRFRCAWCSLTYACPDNIAPRLWTHDKQTGEYWCCLKCRAEYLAFANVAEPSNPV